MGSTEDCHFEDPLSEIPFTSIPLTVLCTETHSLCLPNKRVPKEGKQGSCMPCVRETHSLKALQLSDKLPKTVAIDQITMTKSYSLQWHCYVYNTTFCRRSLQSHEHGVY